MKTLTFFLFQDVSRHCGIRCMPTFHFYKGGEKVSDREKLNVFLSGHVVTPVVLCLLLQVRKRSFHILVATNFNFILEINLQSLVL